MCVGEAWGRVSKDEKAEYEGRAREDSERYKRELKAWQREHPEEYDQVRERERHTHTPLIFL